MQKYTDVILSPLGTPVGGATVAVTNYPDGTPATIYATAGGAAVASVQSDPTGRFAFYAADGHYSLSISGNGILPQTISDIVLNDPSNEATSANLAAPGGAALIGTSDGSTVQAKLTANAAAIASNTTSIASNSTAISSNTSAIAGKVNTADLAASTGAGLVGYGTLTVKTALDILYYGVKNPMNPKYSGGAVGDGVAYDYAALSACYADTSSPFVSLPAGKTFLVNSAVAVPSGTITHGAGATVKGTGTVGLFSLTYPSIGTEFHGLTLDGQKTSGTTDVVTLIYAPGSTTTPTNKGSRLKVIGCTLRNGSAGVAFENALYCLVANNHIEAMYRHTTGPYAGSYGYGVVFNGCQNSRVEDNTIGTDALPCERHGVYMPVFLDSQSSPTFVNYPSSIQIIGNRISMRHDPANEPYSSCIEAWNFFDLLIASNQLIGGVRGFNATPEYQNGGRVQLIGNLFRDNEICIRNDRATMGTSPGTRYFEAYEIVGNTLCPLTSVASHQAVFLQGVKSIIFNSNYCKGSASTSFAFGYYDVTYNNIVADLISSKGNIISGFAQGFYLANVTKFLDDSAFSSFTGNPLPYVRNANIGSSEMLPKLTPSTALYAYNTGDWAGVTYYEPALGKSITNNGSFWVDAKGLRVRGPTANRPATVSIVAGSAAAADGVFAGLEYGFKYYDEGAAAMLYWNGALWATSQQPAPPLTASTTDLNTFKTTYPNAVSYGAMSYNTTTNKPVFYNGSTGNWIYADGTAI